MLPGCQRDSLGNNDCVIVTGDSCHVLLHRVGQMIQRTMYVLAVQNLLESASYYRDVLGFSVREIGDDGWRIFERDGCQIMAGHCPDSIPVKDLGDHSYFAYWVIDDVDSYYSDVISSEADVIKPLRDEPWGMREFGIRTNDGHRIMLGQEIER